MPHLKTIPGSQADGSVRAEYSIIGFHIANQRWGGIVVKEVIRPEFDIEALGTDGATQDVQLAALLFPGRHPS